MCRDPETGRDPAAEKGALSELLRVDPDRLTDLFVSTFTRQVERRLARLPVPTERRSAQFMVTTRAVAGSRTVRFTASTAGLDRHGTKIKSEGIDTSNYEKKSRFWLGP